GSDAAAVADEAGDPDRVGVVAAALVLPEAQRSRSKAHDEIGGAVGVEVGGGEARPGQGFRRSARERGRQSGGSHIGPAPAEVAKEPRALVREDQQVQQTVVVVVDELGGGGVLRARRGRYEVETTPAVAEGQDAGTIRPSEEEVREAVLVHVGRGHAAKAAGRRQSGS